MLNAPEMAPTSQPSSLGSTIRHRFGLPRSTGPLLVVDIVAIAFAYTLTTMLVSSLSGDGGDRGSVAKLVLCVAVIQVVLGIATRTYLGRWRVGTFGEAGGLLAVTAGSTIGGLLVNEVFDPNLVARPEPLIAGFIALVAMAAPRAAWRFQLHHALSRSAVPAQRVVLLGAGEGAFYLLPFLQAAGSPYRPVALLDDDPSKKFRRIQGVPVVGACDELGAVARRVSADLAIIAVPSADGELIRRLVELCDDAKVEVKVLPHVSELVGGLSVGDIRAVSETDVLGRRATQLDLEAMAAELHGKRVLITGAGGSIGSELSRQVYRFGPSELYLLDRDESALHGVMLSMTGRARLESETAVLCDIRDRDAVRNVFAEPPARGRVPRRRAQARPMFERFPDEALKTNVLGTLNVLDAARRVRRRAVHQHLDRQGRRPGERARLLEAPHRVPDVARRCAVRPTRSSRCGSATCSARVARCSRPSAARSPAAGPITVTHPEVTRYFMMVEEAVALDHPVRRVGRAGEVLILDMGEPVLIDDVAKLMASGSPRKIAIEYTGLRPGEKLHEELIGEGEIDDRPFHPEITQTLVPAISEASLSTLLDRAAPAQAEALMIGACATALAEHLAKVAAPHPAGVVAHAG